MHRLTLILLTTAVLAGCADPDPSRQPDGGNRQDHRIEFPVITGET